MNPLEYHSDVLIIGAGPAGLAAAKAALEAGCEVDLVDDNFQSGGQIWRGGGHLQKDQRAKQLAQVLTQSNQLRCHFQSKLIHIGGHKDDFTAVLDHTQTPASASSRILAKRIIIATGAREVLLPFHGWTLPGVTGAGGLQALAKTGYPVEGKRIVVAGTGPLLLAVAASLVERGAIVTHIVEQSSFAKLRRFTWQLFVSPSKLKQAIQLAWALRKQKYWCDSFVIEAHGTEQLTGVTILKNGIQHSIDCDYLACGYGLAPNLEIAAGLGCEIDYLEADQTNGAMPSIRVDETQESSIAGVYCAGETTGVGGVDLSLAEGCIAGHAAALSLTYDKHSDSTSSLAEQELAEAKKQRKHWQKFAQDLHQAFQLRSELKQLCRSDTIVCRCEDVRFEELQTQSDWRSAKLHTRCGMGACQGRVCGNANHILFGWKRDVGRLPLQATSIHNLLAIKARGRQDEFTE